MSGASSKGDETGMKHTPVSIWKEKEYIYPIAFGFRPDLVPYLHEDEQDRPCVIVVPGGGYALASPTEGELVADRFYQAGYQAFVFTYTTNLLKAAPLMDLPMRELARAVRLIRSQAGVFRVDPNRILLCGFSAGAHLCGSVCTRFNEIEEPDEVLCAVSARPDAAILSYPVITSGRYAHQDSFRHLLGADIYDRKDPEAVRLLDDYSLEKQVTDSTPPCFLWQTVTDELVPVENSLLMAKALKEHGVPFALHLFSQGRHGLSLADERWAERRFGDSHCANQLTFLQKAVESGALSLPEPTRSALMNLSSAVDEESRSPNPQVRVWPDLALDWLREVLEM